jgi:hypothetical protein
MLPSTFRAAAIDVVRLMGWRRWAFAAAALAVVAWTVAEDLAGRALSGGFAVNAWDVPLEANNNFAILCFVLVPLFAAVVGDLTVRDRLSGYVRFTAVRQPSRTQWWLAKLLALGVAAVVFFTLAWAVMAAVGAFAFHGLPPHLSEYGRATPNPFGTLAEVARYYGPPPLAAAPAVVGVGLTFAYSGVAVWGLVAVCMAATARWARPWPAVLATLGVTLGFSAVPAVSALHPLVHLLWDTHTFSVTNAAVAWWASGVVITGELACAAALGAILLRRADMVPT